MPAIGSFVPRTVEIMSRPPNAAPSGQPLRVSLIAVPDAMVSTLAGLYDVMNAPALRGSAAAPPGVARFELEIVGECAGSMMLASGVPFAVQRSIASLESTDIVIVPSVLLREAAWVKGRYPALVAWLQHVHARGALLCSACSGVFLLAETGAFDGKDATVHFNYQRQFAEAYPQVSVHPERALVVSGEREDLVCSGASTTWHDMVLYLIARFAGAAAAQDVARLYALQWHHDGLAPYVTFEGRSDHGDGEIEGAQRWLVTNFSLARPVDEMNKRSSLAARTFKRRFTSATGLAPIAYVQRLRIEDAKRRLERSEAPVDDIGWRVGYEDPAFFRRLFKRTTGLTPGAYRKRFRLPEFARP